MKDRRTQAWMILGVWSIVLLAFLLLFFIGGGPPEWQQNSNARFLSAIVLAVGYIVFLMIQRKGKALIKDERDHLVELKSGNVTMILVLMYVFIFGISLFVAYESAGYMPVSWMWFLAYTTIFITYILNSVFYLWYEKRIGGYGRY